MKRWPLKEVYFWEVAPFFRLLLPLIIGIALYRYVPIFSSYVTILAIVSLVIYLLTVFIKSNRSTRVISFISLHLIIAATGWLLSYFNDVTTRQDYFGYYSGDNKSFIARVEDDPAEKERTLKLQVSVFGIIDHSSITPTVGEAFVYVYKNEQPVDLKKGDTILLPEKWQPIKNAGNPYEFDYAAYCARNNLYYQQFVAPKEVLISSRSSANDIVFTEHVHDWCMMKLEKYLANTPALGLLQAMLIGDEANLDSDIRQTYSDTGIVHIIAISGSHITFFFLLIAFLLGWIRNRKYHWLKYILALPLIWFYVLMAGASPSAIRAAVMFSLLAIGFAFQKQHNSLNQLFATAFVLLCAEPMWLYATGFQLSFVAVLSLVVFYKPVLQMLSPANRFLKVIWQAIAASFAAEILVAPLVIYYFHLFPAMFLVANLAAFLFMGIVLIAGILIILFSSLPSVAGILAICTATLVDVFNKLVEWLKQFNPEPFYFLQLDSIGLLLTYISIAAIAIFFIRQKKGALYTGLVAISVLLILLCIDKYYASKQAKLVVYNISRTSHIELIKGTTHSVLATDYGIDPLKKNYATKAAHTKWNAWRKIDIVERTSAVKIGASTAVLLQKPDSSNSTVKAAYVIVEYPYQPGAVKFIKEKYQPLKLVLTSKLTRTQSEKWANACAAISLPFHSVSSDGAFILSAE